MEFERFKLLVGDNFSKIQSLKVLILGVGGVGGYATESLARCGVLDITIVDYDIVDVTNINRQIIALQSNVGRKKVEVMKERIKDINKNCQVTCFDMFYSEENKEKIFSKSYDYILDCCDSIPSKESIIREAIKRRIKIISSMGAGYKMDPAKIEIAKLKDTSYDKIAKILRQKLKDSKECLNVLVVYSKEITEKHGKVIASNAFIPSIFGLYMTSFIINDCLMHNK